MLEVVDFRFISAFNIPAYIMSSEFTHKVVIKFIQAQFPCTNIFDVKVFFNQFYAFKDFQSDQLQRLVIVKNSLLIVHA